MSNAKLHDRVLLIEDDILFARSITSYLNRNELQVEHVGTAADLYERLDTHGYDCFIVDLTLPDEDGIVLIRKLRARSETPIIVLTGREGMDDKLVSFELGADDYVTKPVDPRELLMRLKSLLRRSHSSGQTSSDVLYLGDFVLDRTRHEAHRSDGHTVDFTPAEFNLIWVLAEADGRVVSRNSLVDALAAGEGPESPRAVDILVSRVRKKLGKEAIATVPKAGYKCGLRLARPDD